MKSKNDRVDVSLWLIFSYYSTASGHACERIRAHQWTTFIRTIFAEDDYGHLRRRLFVTSCQARRVVREGLDFAQFVSELSSVARAWIQEQAGEGSPLHSQPQLKNLQNFIETLVLPRARRFILPVEEPRGPSLACLEPFVPALQHLFHFYAQRPLIMTVHMSRRQTRPCVWNYAQFEMFLRDFELLKLLRWSTREKARLFATTCVVHHQTENNFHVMDFAVFQRSLGRMASQLLVSTTSSSSDSMNHEKQQLQALLQYLTQVIHRSQLILTVPSTRSTKVVTTDFVIGASALKTTFLSMWKQDGYPNYFVTTSFEEKAKAEQEGQDLLEALVARSTFPRSPPKSKKIPKKKSSMSTLLPTWNAAQKLKDMNVALDRNLETIQSWQADPRSMLGPAVGSPANHHHHHHYRVTNFPSAVSSTFTTASEWALMNQGVEENPEEPQLGGVFIKYSTWGQAHQRYVWLDAAAATIYWKPLLGSKKSKHGHVGIHLDDVRDIVPANDKRIQHLYRKRQKMLALTMRSTHEELESGSSCAPNQKTDVFMRSFSIIAKDRRLDLETSTEEERDMWIEKWTEIVEEHHHHQSVIEELRVEDE